MTKVRVWLSHDGYRDPDDNLAMLVGAAKARSVAKSDADVAVAGVIFGDTTDGGQYHMAYPLKKTPASMGGDSRFDDHAMNKVAAGNYAFFKKYAVPALKQLAPGWTVIDTVKGEVESSWNYQAKKLAGISYAARELVADIRDAINKGGGANPKEVVVYSAGGGAHVPAEAIGFLRNSYSDAKIKEHFAIVQHGRTNFALNLEPEARNITRTFTIPIAKQDLDHYANGAQGPGLGKLARGGVYLEGDRFGQKMALALDVAQGLKAFQNLGPNKTFRATTDGSDAGSHAFAVADTKLLSHWNDRLKPGESLSSEVGHEHQVVKAGGGYRLRVMYNDFDWKDARALMNGGRAAGASEASTESVAASAATKAAVAGEPAGLAATPAGAAVQAAEPAHAVLGAKAAAALALGEADVFAFASDGSAAAAVTEGGRTGVAGHGAENEIDRVDGASERLVVDLGTPADAVAIVLAGLEQRGGAREAAEITGYDEDGHLVATRLVTRNGRTELAFDEAVRYAAIEAADWQGAEQHPAEHPAFGLVWIEAL